MTWHATAIVDAGSANAGAAVLVLLPYEPLNLEPSLQTLKMLKELEFNFFENILPSIFYSSDLLAIELSNSDFSNVLDTNTSCSDLHLETSIT